MTKVRLNGKILTIELRLQEPALSASGKSMVVASTRGQINTGIEYKGSDILVVANAYIRRDDSSAPELTVRRKGQKDAKSTPEAS
jgi:hypothetical protein